MWIRAVALGVLVLLAEGCGAGGSGAAGESADTPASFVSPLTVQSEIVRLRRAQLETMAVAVPDRQQQIEGLAGALILLADLHFDAAVQADPKAAAIAPPRDRDERTGQAAPEAVESAADASEPPARDEAELAGLAPASREHVLEADRTRVEALVQIDRLLPGPRPASVLHLYAARARLYDDLGQRIAARNDWLYIVRVSETPPELEMEGWLVFAAWFAARNEYPDARRAVAKAISAADRVRDAARVAQVCARVRRTRPVASSVCP